MENIITTETASISFTAEALTVHGPSLWTSRCRAQIPPILGPIVLPNGTMLMSFKAGSRYKFTSELCRSHTCESLGVVAAPSWDSFPYQDQSFLNGASVDKKFIGGGGCLEDPSNGYVDNVRGAVHQLFHQGNPNASSASRADGGDRGGKMPWGCAHLKLGTGIPSSNSSWGYGGTVHSADNGTSWMYSTPYWQGLGWKEGTRSTVAYTYEVAMKDGSTIDCIRREEPKLLLGDDGQPEALITQCSMMPLGQSPPDANGHSYGTQWSTQLVVQPINAALSASFVNISGGKLPTKTDDEKADDYEAIIADTHRRAAANRAQRVASWDSFDFGYNETIAGPPASSTWTGIGFGHVPAAIGSMFSNKNASAIRLANDFIVNMTENFKYNGFVPVPQTNCSIVMGKVCGSARSSVASCEACAGAHLHELEENACQSAEVAAVCASAGPPPTRAACFAHALNRSNSSFARCNFGLPLERSHLVRAFALFDPGSRFAKSKELPAWGVEATEALRSFFLAQTQGMLYSYPQEVYISSLLNMFGSENIDSSGQVTTFLALDVLNALPEYSAMRMADGDTVATHYTRLERYVYDWLKSKAQRGLFSELGSSGYWSRT